MPNATNDQKQKLQAALDKMEVMVDAGEKTINDVYPVPKILTDLEASGQPFGIGGKHSRRTRRTRRTHRNRRNRRNRHTHSHRK